MVNTSVCLATIEYHQQAVDLFSPFNHEWCTYYLNSGSVNGQAFNSQAFSSEPGAVKEIKKGFFFKYVLTHSHEKVSVELVVPKNTEVSLKVFETSFDLLERLDDVQARDSIYMPEPFVINDAVIIGQSVKI